MFYYGMDSLYDREANLQSDITRNFMKDHFKRGQDAKVLKFSKASVTSENMVSSRPGWPSKAQRAKEDMEKLRLENKTQVKIENSLLFQQNTEL